jgi:hypothetical protein
VAVAFVRHHHRQQEWIKITAIVQLAAGKYTNIFNKIIPSQYNYISLIPRPQSAAL